jgi:hypothetical protein
MKKIRKITRYHSVVGENDELLHEYKRSLQEFDINNNRIKDIDYTSSGEIETASRFKYDDKDRLIEEMHYFDEEEVGEVVRYKFNEEGKTKEIETTYADGSVSLKKISRLENMLSVKAYDEDGEQDGEDLIKYNEDGKVVEEINFDEDHAVAQRAVYTYNNKQQVESRIDYGAKDEFLQKVVFEYDNNGNAVRETQLNRKDKPVRQVVYNYNKENKLVGWENSQHMHKSKYNEEGKLVYEETINNINKMVEGFTEYKFDEDGLLAQSRSFEMGEQYQMQPGVMARTKLNFVVIRYEYEFFNEVD